MRRAARYLAISSKKSMWALKKKLSLGAKSSIGSARGQGRLDVGEPVGQREGELLGGARSGLADVVAGDRHRMPARQLRRAEAHDVGHQAHRGPRREDVLLLGLVLLQDVVLEGARQRAPLDAGLVGDGDVHGEDRCRGRVDRHGGRHPAEIDASEEGLHVDHRVDCDPGPAHLTLGPRVVRVATQQGRHVEGGREPVPAGAQQLLEAAVGVLGACRSRRTGASSTGASGTWTRRGRGVGVRAGQLGALRPVDGLERHARHGLEARRPKRRAVELLLPRCACRPSPNDT